MKFDSSILLETTSKNIEIASREFIESLEPCSYLSSLLEFNDNMHRLDVEEKINYYKMLTESSLGNCTEDVFNEGIANGIKEFISKAIHAILDFIKKIFGVFKNKYDENLVKDFEECKKISASGKIVKDIESGEKLYLYKHINIMDSKFSSMSADSSIASIVANIEALCRGENVKNKNLNAVKEKAYSELFKMMRNNAVENYNKKVFDSKSFKDFCDNAIFVRDETTKSLDEISNFYRSRLIPDNKDYVNKYISKIQDKLNHCNDIVNRATNIDETCREEARSLLTALTEIIQNWIWFINKTYELDQQMARHFISIVKKHYESVHLNSALIHGESFDGDTIFANNDIRDFNPTEWLDLTLQTEAYAASYEALETRRIIAAEEARIIIEHNGIGCEKELFAMREAQANNLSEKFRNIIDYISKAIQEFIARFTEQMNMHSKYIKANIDTINKPFKFTGKMESTGDILNGIGRVTPETGIVAFDYNAQKSDLKDEKEFFGKFVKSKLTETCRAIWPSNLTVAEWCKCYFGASMPKDRYKPIEFTSSDLEKHREKIMNFLQQGSIITGIKKEMAVVKAEADKAAHFTAQSDTAVQATSQQASNESYYSELYGKYLHEVDTSNANTDADKSDGGPAAGENVQKNEKKEQKKADNERTSAFRNYLMVYRSVLTAKMTAAAFIRSELFQIIKFHVNTYKKGQAAAAAEQNNPENNPEAAEQQSAQAPQEKAPKKGVFGRFRKG